MPIRGLATSDGVNGEVGFWGLCRRAAGPVAALLRGLTGVLDDGCVIGDLWGVSEYEVARSYPCDAFVSSLGCRRGGA